MRIPAEASIAAIENALRQLSGSTLDARLKLPTNIRHTAGGAEAALSQLVVTWAQGRQVPILETWVGNDDQAGDFVRRLPGLTAALCASDIMGLGTTGSVMAKVREVALARLAVLQSGKPSPAFRGSSVEIPCIDHIGRDTPYLLSEPGSSEHSKLRPRSAFTDLASYLLGRTVPNEYQPFIRPETPEALGGIIFELFKNTEDHAQTDASGNVLDISIRAIKTVHHGAKPDDLAAVVADFPPLAHFCSSLRPPRNATQTHLFELSVLDSGPGFAASRLGRPLGDISAADEETAVRDCFSTFSAKGGSRFGQGLPHVLRLLSRERGFLRLRTGRISLHADFSASDWDSHGDLLETWLPPDCERLAPVAGSLLTVLIPLRRDE